MGEFSPKTGTNNEKNLWKIKAVARSQEIKKLKRKVKDLTISRDHWRGHYKSLKLAYDNLLMVGQGAKVADHHYGVSLMQWCMLLCSYAGMSFRTCRHCISSLYIVLGLSQKVPCASTIRSWVYRYSYHLYQDCLNERGGAYVIWIDESVGVGKEKVLLVLGQPEQEVCYSSALKLEQVVVLYIGLSKRWQGDDILRVLKALSERITISYIVSDEGKNLVNAYGKGGYIHVPDCTHRVSGILKKLYQKDKTFSDFGHFAARLRQQWHMSDYAALMPPAQRHKVRFANMFVLVDWAERCLSRWETFDQQVAQKLSFLKENESFIKELIVLRKHVAFIFSKLKNHGCSQKNIRKIQARLHKTGSEKEKMFSRAILQYCAELKQCNSKKTQFICCSDVIESTWGKLKYKQHGYSSKQMTESIFTLTNTNKDFTPEKIEQALKNVTQETLKNWREKVKKQE